MKTHRYPAGLYTSAAILLALLATITTARAATITVTSLADDGGPGELRAAINTANNDSGDTITFKSGLKGTITLTSGLPTITTNMTIAGPGASVIAVDGAKHYQPFNISAGSVTISGLTIQNGNAEDGGGIYNNNGTLTLTNCTLSGNTANYGGGGIDNDFAATATLTNCTLSRNSAYNGGGGIYNDGDTATLTNCTLSGNTAKYGGGSDNGSTATFTNCALSGNTAQNGGGIYNAGYTATLTNCTLSGNIATYNGGGIYNDSGGTYNQGKATLTNCTLSGNIATYNGGGGIYNGGGGGTYNQGYDSTATLTNCTLSDNSAHSGGGGIYNDTQGTATLTNCILYGDSGGEVWNIEWIGASYCDIQGGVGPAPGITDNGNNINADPLLEPLANNGGPTQTMALGAGSPCLGAGLASAAPHFDQRILARPVAPSIGAWDSGTSAPSLEVTTTSDSGAGSLRWAMETADVLPNSTVTFQSGLKGAITLKSGLPAITTSMTIQGPGASVIAIDGAGKLQPFYISAGSVTISGLTVQNGNAQNGGGIYNEGTATLTLTNCTLSGNTAASNGDLQYEGGGGIYNDGNTLTLTNCTLSDNTATNGGGIYNAGYTATLTLTNCTLSGNTANSGSYGSYGGGIYNAGYTATLTNCTLSGNSGYDIYNGGNTLTLTNCILYGDSGAEVDSNGPIDATYCDIQGGYQGTYNINAAPLLGPLANNGGPTETMALGAGSPCFGAGLASAAPATDQRGVTRPNPPSIGAYDLSAPITAALVSVTLNPTSVTGGSPSTGTMTVSAAAPTGGLVVTLTSSNTAAATVPASLTVAAGASTATFTVTTKSVSAATTVTITANAGGVNKTATLTVNPPAAALTGVSLSPTSVTGGSPSTGTLTLSATATTGGLVVTLTSSNTAAATIPASVSVAAGASTATFTVTTKSVSAAATVTITAAAGRVNKTATLTVNPPAAALTGVSLNPTSVTGGSPSTGTLTLSRAAPTGGLAVTLTSSNTAAATIPASVSVAAGASTATFTVTTKSVSAAATVTITAAAGRVNKTATLTVNPPAAALTGVSLNPTSVTGGSPSTGTLTLSRAAPTGGLAVTLTSSNTAAATIPASVSVAAGASTATFTVTTKSVSAAATVTITAAAGGVNKTATLTVNPPAAALTGVSLSPTSVTGGSPSTGTLTLSRAAPTGGLAVTLTSSNTAAATIPASVTVAAGVSTATFTVTTKSVSAAATVTITAAAGGVNKTATLTVNPMAATLTGVSLNPTSVTGGSPSTGTLTLSRAAPTGGLAVTLTSSNTAAATIPASVSVAAGASTATFTVTTKSVSSNTPVTITATANGASKTCALTVSPAGVPTGVTATANGSVITLKWNPVSGATGYWVKWALENGGPFTKLPTLTTGTTINLSGAVAGVTYYYEISAVNSSGEGSNSGQVSVTPTLAGLPAAPGGVTAAANGSTITLSWNPVSGATGYWVKWALKNGGPFTKLSSLTSGTSVSLSGAVAGVTYYYEISAVNGVGEGPNSAQVSVTPTLSGLTPAPTGVTATASGSTITLRWNAVSGATGYWVKWALKNGGPFTKLSTLTTGTSINLSGAVAGVTYYYEISAVNGVGEGANSAQVSVTPTVAGLPAAPTGVTATANGSVITLTWNPVSGATGYWVKWALRNGGPFTKLSSLTTGTSVSLSGAVAGVTYYYEISAVNGVGEGANSAQVSVTPVLVGLPPAPTGVTATVIGSTITLKWNAVSGATGYWVKWALKNGGPFTKLSSLTTGTSVSLSGAVVAITYYYEISAVNGVGEGANSVQVAVTD